MLGKLFKYEFKACARQLFPLYILTIIVAILLRATFNFSQGMLQTSLMLIFTAICTAVAVVTLFLTIRRFTRNVLGDEGYLTMTLPVKTSSVIWSKLLNSMLYVFFGTVVAIVAFLILTDAYTVFFNGNFYRELFAFLGELQGIDYVGIVNVCLSLIIGLGGTILLVYFSASVSQLSVAYKYRGIASFVVFVVLCIVLTNLCGVIENLLPIEQLIYIDENATAADVSRMMNIVIGAANAFGLAVSAACFAGTNYILKNKLNLQ